MLRSVRDSLVLSPPLTFERQHVDELIETTLDPETRVLRRITMEDAKVAEDMFDVLMGSDVGRRRDFLVSNTDLVDPEALDV